MLRKLRTKFGDLAAILLGIALVSVIGYRALLHKSGGWSNWGFGPEWHCMWAGHGDPICIKQPASN